MCKICLSFQEVDGFLFGGGDSCVFCLVGAIVVVLCLTSPHKYDMCCPVMHSPLYSVVVAADVKLVAPRSAVEGEEVDVDTTPESKVNVADFSFTQNVSSSLTTVALL